jgi:uncharacterized repeat protein (TIGR03803 family)
MKFLPVLFIFLLGSLATTAQETLWGMAAANATGNGTIFKTDAAGNAYTDVYTFTDPLNGLDPYGSLIQTTNGMLYGLTSRGGALGFGVLFKINPTTGTYTKLHDFDSVNGKSPFGTLLQAPNGKLYGMTHGGGIEVWPAKDRGIIFEFDPATNVLTKKKDLLPKHAATPFGSFSLGADGHLYGLSSAGGVDATGMIFQYNYLLDSFTRMGSFISGPAWEGYYPHGQMVQAANGFFYGFSRFGQAMGSGGGVIFKFDATTGIWDGVSSVYKLSELAPDSANGYELLGSPIQATDGKLYGMAVYGGASGAGTLFSYDLSTNTFTKLHDFNPDTDGFAPQGSLIQAANGMLYGLTTSPGGVARLFQFHIVSGVFSIKATLTGTPYYTSLTRVAPPPAHVTSVSNPSQLSAYPNPVCNTLNFYTNINPATYQLSDAQARVVLHGNTTGSTTRLNIAHLPSGAYTLRICSGSTTASTTIIKE